MNSILAREAQKAVERISLWQEFKANILGRKIYLGHETREGQSDKLPFYLFWCDACDHYAKDYPHGYIDGCKYLICSYCEVRHYFVSW